MQCPATHRVGFTARYFQMLTIMIKTNTAFLTGFHHCSKILDYVMIPGAEGGGFCAEEQPDYQKMQSP